MPVPAPPPPLQVLLPFHRDSPPLFRRALESVAGQTYPHWECLLLADGAGPDLLAMARAFAARDPRFRLVERGHRGLVAALNEGLRLATAPFVARMDADDTAAPERLERQMRLAETTTSPALIGCGVRIAGGMKRFERWLASVDTHARVLREAFVDCPLPHPTWLARPGDLLSLGGYRPGDLPEDYDLFLRMVARGWTFQKAEGDLLTLTHHPARLTMTDPRYRPRAFRRVKWEHLAPRLAAGRAINIIGGGATARAWLALLQDDGFKVDKILDIRPTRIGKVIRGVRVEEYSTHPFTPGPFHLVALPRLEQRDEVRGRLASRGLEEFRDFLCVT